jgi:hypothetical protein
MNVDPRCRQPFVRPTAGRGSILPSQPDSGSTPQLAPALPAPPVPQSRINFAIAVCLAASFLMLLAGPEFTSI